MNNLRDERGFFLRQGPRLLLAAVIVSGGFVYTAKVTLPPGFYIDESSISYNAHLISQNGHDEYSEPWPLYFRAFGDYKNPIYIYLLAALFRVTGPSITAARLLSATLGMLAGLLLGLLGWRISKRMGIGLIVAISAWLTPWLFESSRLVFEVSIYPLLVACFLLALWRAAAKAEWKVTDILALSILLALLTYSYSIGRLLAPLLAAGLAFFITRRRWQGVLKVWLVYVALLVPLFVFNLRNPGALSARFDQLTYIKPTSSYVEIASEFLGYFAANINPWRWLVTGENNVRDHFTGHGSLLVITALLGFVGLMLVLQRHRNAAWWRFVVYAWLISFVPASLTKTEFPQLRLIAVPVFFHVFLVPALSWFYPSVTEDTRTNMGRRVAVAVVITLLLIQGIFFQWLFYKRAPELWYVFDARFPRKILAAAVATGKRPIYLLDPPGKSGYIQAYWYATIEQRDTTQFVRLSAKASAPTGSVVISTEEQCSNCQPIAKGINYIVYAVLPYDSPPVVSELPPSAFRARIVSENLPLRLPAGSNTALNVLVVNQSNQTWPAIGGFDDRGAVILRNRWLAVEGTLLNDRDGSSRLPYDLEPGDTAGTSLQVTAPDTPGEYLLELDLVENKVTWFGDRGSETLRWRLNIDASR